MTRAERNSRMIHNIRTKLECLDNFITKRYENIIKARHCNQPYERFLNDSYILGVFYATVSLLTMSFGVIIEIFFR